MTMPSLFASIIIPTHNREQELKDCLDSLVEQSFDHSKYEVIVVDDGSSVDIVSTIEKQRFRIELKVFRIEHSGPSTARNIGIQKARGEFIIFFEDDIIADREYLANAWRHIQKEQFDVLEGTTFITTRRKKVRRFEAEETLSFIPCNLLVRKSIIEELGGYDPEFYDQISGLYFREDAEFGFRLLAKGVKIAKVVDLIVEHPEQFLTIHSCLRHARRYYFDPLLYRKHPKRYRQFIETKCFLGIQFHRPLHLLSIGIVCTFIVILAGFYFYNLNVTIIGLSFTFIFAGLIRFKYQGLRVFYIYELYQLGAFIILPFIYWRALLKGCVRFKSFGCLL